MQISDFKEVARGFGQGAYRRRSETTSMVLDLLFQSLRREDFAMSYTMEDFKRDYFKDRFARLTPEERREFLQSLPAEERREFLQSLPAEERRDMLESLPLEERLAGLSAEQIRRYLDRLTAARSPSSRKPRRRK